MNPPRPRPRLDAVNRPFWTGGNEGKLMIMHCDDCGQYLQFSGHRPVLMD